MDDEQDYKQYEVKEGIIFLIELSDALFMPRKTLNNQSQLLEILSSVDELMSDMIMTYPKNGVGIYFYHSKETSKKFPKDLGIAKLFSLNDLNSSNMKKLSEMVRDHLDGFRPLDKSFSVAEEEKDNLHTILRTVLREFQAKTQYNVKKLYWFTNNEKPYINPDLKDSLRTLLTDFDDNSIWVSPVFLGRLVEGEGSFDISLYKNIFLNTNFLKNALGISKDDKKSENNQVLSTLSSDIKKLIFKLKNVRRIQFACDLVLSDGKEEAGSFGCSIKGYTLYNRETIRPFRNVYTEGGRLKLVHSSYKYLKAGEEAPIDLDNAELESKTLTQKKEEHHFVKGVPVKVTNKEIEGSNEKVIFVNDHTLQFMKGSAFDNDPLREEDEDNLEDDEDDEDEKKNESVGKTSFITAPYLKLVCFRKQENIQPFLNLKSPIFVTADMKNGLASTNRERGYLNSLDTMSALYQSCVKLKRYAVLFGCTKRNSYPNLYILYPTKIENSSLCLPDRDLPDGFLLMQMPWLGEVRSLPEYMLQDDSRFFKSTENSPVELVMIMKELIQQIGAERAYDPSKHTNPVLEYFYRTIKLEALQMDVKEEDRSLEKNDWSVQKISELRQKILDTTDHAKSVQMINIYLDSVVNAETLKRGTEESESVAKKKKVEPLTEQHVIYLWKHNKWNEATVAQLKDFISRYNGSIKSATRKADMVENIENFLESRRK